MTAMENLNYCRQVIKQFTGYIARGVAAPYVRDILPIYIDLAKRAQKFLLPENGRPCEDRQYKALNEKEPLHLPYPIIALEYERHYNAPMKKGLIESSKALILAEELEETIRLSIVAWYDAKKVWLPLPQAAIPRVDYLNREHVVNGYVSIKAAVGGGFPLSDIADEAGTLINFLNILQCKNVHIEKNITKREIKHNSTFVKTAFPFDTYHILTIDTHRPGYSGNYGGTHRSPREHLRRGHVRNLASGVSVWVNACIVAAKTGSGKCVKDYAIK